MGIFRSKNRKLAGADSGSNTASRGFKLGFRKIFGTFGKYVSCMFATAAPARTYVDVYHRPTFNKCLDADPGNGFSAADLRYAENLRCGSFKTVGIKKCEYRLFDNDEWTDDEKREYDSKFIAIQLNDEVADMMKMSVCGIESDAIEVEDYGCFSEADIAYEEVEIPEVRPGFLPEILMEEVAEETPVEEIPIDVQPVEETPAEEIPMEVEETPVAVPLVEEIEVPVAEEPVEMELEEETAQEVEVEIQPLAIETPAIAGLLAEPREETAEQPVTEAAETEIPVVEVALPETIVAAEPETVVEEPKAVSMFSFGFGTASAASEGPVAFRFGFGAEEEKAEESSFITNSVFVSSDAVGQKA